MTRLVGDLARIEELVGRDCALAIARAFGGRQIYIPASCAGAMFDELSAAVGPECARTIIEEFARDTIYVPKARKALVPWLIERGLSTGEIADELGIARASVRQYVAAA